ncbi:MAG: ABC transporter substrate binding protein [Roseiarcus sp.]
MNLACPRSPGNWPRSAWTSSSPWGPALFAARQATSTIPIVTASGGDLVGLGLVSSLAHPGGNITGLTFFIAELFAKRLEMLAEIAPSLARAGLLQLRTKLPGGEERTDP